MKNYKTMKTMDSNLMKVIFQFSFYLQFFDLENHLLFPSIHPFAPIQVFISFPINNLLLCIMFVHIWYNNQIVTS